MAECLIFKGTIMAVLENVFIGTNLILFQIYLHDPVQPLRDRNPLIGFHLDLVDLDPRIFSLPIISISF